MRCGTLLKCDEKCFFEKMKYVRFCFCIALFIIGILGINTNSYAEESERKVVDLSAWNNAKVLNLSNEETINISDVSERHYYVLTASEGRYYKLTLNGDSVYTKLCVYNSEGVEEYVSSDNSKSKSMSKDFIFNEGEKY